MTKEDLYRIGAGVAVAAVAVTGIASCARSNDAGPADPGPSVTAPAETPSTQAPDAVDPEPANCSVGTIVSWDDIETVRATLPDGCDIWLLGPEPTPEPAGERQQRLVEWAIAGNDTADFPEKEMVYPDGIIFDTTEPAPTTVGETIPAWQIDAAREAGASVFVSPRGDGSGLIVDPNGPLPEVVVQNIREIAQMPVSDFGQLRDRTVAQGEQSLAMHEAGIQAITVMQAPRILGGEAVGYDWAVLPVGLVDPNHPNLQTVAATQEEAWQLFREQVPSFADAEIVE